MEVSTVATRARETNAGFNCLLETQWRSQLTPREREKPMRVPTASLKLNGGLNCRHASERNQCGFQLAPFKLNGDLNRVHTTHLAPGRRVDVERVRVRVHGQVEAVGPLDAQVVRARQACDTVQWGFQSGFNRLLKMQQGLQAPCNSTGDFTGFNCFLKMQQGFQQGSPPLTQREQQRVRGGGLVENDALGAQRDHVQVLLLEDAHLARERHLCELLPRVGQRHCEREAREATLRGTWLSSHGACGSEALRKRGAGGHTARDLALISWSVWVRGTAKERCGRPHCEGLGSHLMERVGQRHCEREVREATLRGAVGGGGLALISWSLQLGLRQR
jgi:hypothetical protein